MDLSRRTVLAGLGASPIAAPLVARAGSYSLKPANDGFAAVLETRDFGALSSDPVIAAELQRKLDQHLVLHVRPEAPLTRETIGRMAYQLGYPKGGAPARRPAASDGYTAQGSMAATGQLARPARPGGEFSFVADFGGPAQPPLTAPRAPGYLETLHYDGISAYSINTTIDVPPTTPHTFADMRAAYRALPRDLKRVVDKGFALHAGMATPQTPYSQLPAFDAKTASRRPLAIAHARTGEPLLYLPKNPASLIEGMDEQEGRQILASLWARVNTQRNRYMGYSADNEALIWDGMGTTHTNPSYARDKARVSWFFIIPSATGTVTQAKTA